MSEKKAFGRPTKYNSEVAKKILLGIQKGSSLRGLIRDNPDLPTRTSIHKWLAENKDFSDQYTRACEIRDEENFEELREIAMNEPDVQRAKLIVNTLQWSLARRSPKKYGDKMQAVHSGTVDFILERKVFKLDSENSDSV